MTGHESVQSATSISTETVLLVTLGYFLLLFVIGYIAEQYRRRGKGLQSNAHIYALSMAVYCTSWTFYGSIGNAARNGLEFLPIYLGPTLIAFAWWFLLRKMVRISRDQNITSIADFLSSRYNRSSSIGTLVTIFAIFGISPYIALQLKAIAETLDILSIPMSFDPLGEIHLPALTIEPHLDTALIAALILAVFGIIFGARHLDSSEHHEGLVVAVAFESLIKLIAFLAVGLFITYGIFDGFGDVFRTFYQRLPEKQLLFTLGTEQTPYIKWFSLIVISMMAVMFLPRQFHIMVTENVDEEHIRYAMWRFPAYLFLINLFVLPITMAGLIYSGGDPHQADYYILTLPLAFGQKALAILVFVGGLSAAAGMVMVSSVAIATMMLSHIFMPLILKLKLPIQNYSGILINLKRFSILAVILLGYFYFRVIGSSNTLANIGLISFVAAAQFAPAIIAGVYWKRASLKAAVSGLCGGFIIWFITLLIPSFVHSGWLSPDLLSDGIFGFKLLKPLELFGLRGFDIYSHCLFWSLIFNLGTLVAVSYLSSHKPEEEQQAVRFTNIFNSQATVPQRLKRISRAPTIMEFVELMSKFIGEKTAQSAITEYLGNQEIDFRGSLKDYELPLLKDFTEKTISGSVGAAQARIILENYLTARGSEMEDVFDIFGTVTISHAAGQEQLSVLYEVAQVVSQEVNLQQVFDRITELLRQQFKFDLVVIRMLEKETSTLQLSSLSGQATPGFGQTEHNINLETYIGQSFITNKTVVINDSDYLEKPLSAQLVKAEGITCFAHTPITFEGEPVGILSAFSKTIKGVFTPAFIALFENIAAQLSIAWRNNLQLVELLEVREQERDLEIAKQIQSALLPSELPRIPGIEVAGLCVPTHQVGGDYYDFIQRGEATYDLIVADVSGHNIGSALLMTETRTFIHAQLDNIEETGPMLQALNSYIFTDLDRAELFVTMFYLKYDCASHRLTYSNAGHNNPLIWRTAEGRCEALDAEGLIFGIMKEISYEEKVTTLHAGDILLLYTDGIIEAEDRNNQLFGMERLARLLEEGSSLPPAELIDFIMNQVRIFTGVRHFKDDVTLLTMKIKM